MSHPVLDQPFPLEELWDSLGSRIENSPLTRPTGLTATDYLDLAETILRPAVEWQDRFGAIIDPFVHFETSTCTPRFVGLLGQLISAGRCTEFKEQCIRSYENCLGRMSLPYNSPEFAIKEIIFAHRGLKDTVSRTRLQSWEDHWRDYRAGAAFNCCFRDLDNNFNTFGLTGEFLRIRAGLGGEPELVDRLIAKELPHIDVYGMYHDPGCPMTYHVVVLQQLALILDEGYAGEYAEELSAAVRRGGLSSLLMQSVVGQAPFGGRSNQFHHMEAQSAALFEVCAKLAILDGDPVLAGSFKRAARRGIELVRPWIEDMDPWRHLKQGFHPKLDHGTDSGGPYSVYGLLAGSLFCTAASRADESIEESITPAEIGGFAFTVDEDFSKVFAAAGGWSLEVDTRANPQKDATGLGRLQAVGLRPEAILSGSIPANPAYSFAFALPQRNLAIGPEWVNKVDLVHRLADFSAEVEKWSLEITERTAAFVIFDVVYEGDFAGVSRVVESYRLDGEGLTYSAQLAPVPKLLRYTVPVIVTDGDEGAKVQTQFGGLRVEYRGQAFSIWAERASVELSDEENTNRNATYRTALVRPSGGGDPILHIGREAPPG